MYKIHIVGAFPRKLDDDVLIEAKRQFEEDKSMLLWLMIVNKFRDEQKTTITMPEELMIKRGCRYVALDELNELIEKNFFRINYKQGRVYHCVFDIQGLLPEPDKFSFPCI